MPTDADHVPAQSHWSQPSPRLAGAEADVAGATPASSASSRGAMALVVVSVAGVLAVIAAVVVVNATDDWWALVPALLIALVATACVLGIVVRMLAGD